MVELLSVQPFSLPHSSKTVTLQTPATRFKPTKTAPSSHLSNLSFEAYHLYRITGTQDYRIEGRIALPVAGLKTSWASSLYPFFVLRKFSIKSVADGRRDAAKLESWAIAGHQSAPSRQLWFQSRMVAFKLETHFDMHWPGEDDNRPASFLSRGLVAPKVLVKRMCSRMQNVEGTSKDG